MHFEEEVEMQQQKAVKPPVEAANETGDKKCLCQYPKLTREEYVYVPFGWVLAMQEEGVKVRP